MVIKTIPSCPHRLFQRCDRAFTHTSMFQTKASLLVPEPWWGNREAVGGDPTARSSPAAFALAFYYLANGPTLQAVVGQLRLNAFDAIFAYDYR